MAELWRPPPLDFDRNRSRIERRRLLSIGYEQGRHAEKGSQDVENALHFFFPGSIRIPHGTRRGGSGIRCRLSLVRRASIISCKNRTKASGLSPCILRICFLVRPSPRTNRLNRTRAIRSALQVALLINQHL